MPWLLVSPAQVQLCAQDESRWEREIGRLQATAAADLSRIRQEATEAAEREARLLRCALAGVGVGGVLAVVIGVAVTAPRFAVA